MALEQTGVSQAAKGRRRKRATDRHADILFAAVEVIADRGYEDARFSDVARQAGTSISTLQYIFGTRKELMIAALDYQTKKWLSDARIRADAIPQPLERLRWLSAYLAFGGETRDETRIDVLVWTEYWRAAFRNEELRAESRDAYAGWRTLVADAISACVDAGLCTLRTDVDSLAEGICALGDGLGVQFALNLPGMTRERAESIMHSWLAAQLSLDDFGTAPDEPKG